MIARTLAAACLVGVLGAVIVQEFGTGLPLGLFNDGRETYEMLSMITLGVIIAALAVLAVEVFARRTLRVGAWVRGGLAAALLFEVMLFAIDVTLVSRGADPPLGGPYREFQTRSGDWIFVKKPHSGSPLGFRTVTPYPTASSGRRLLFLGDSYTEGSARDRSCNYPNVAAATLASQSGVPVAVLNAGVAGYGPRDAVGLLRHLLEEGYEADAIVYGLFLENDFTDNLPGTTRRVVAGINFRFPESGFLRRFHPLNSRSFRYALFIDRAIRIPFGGGVPAQRADGPCVLEPQERAAELPRSLVRLARRRLEGNYGGQVRTATAEVESALRDLRLVAGDRPVFLVVFPDRILVDDSLVQAMGVQRDLYATGRLQDWVDDVWPDAIHVEQALSAGAENFRTQDTHLSDLGNSRAGQYVGRALVGRLGW
ncbi:MAG: SGNH/GDSL hydrolase family protein [bacterium]|nr:SGNH/GDSL hydrolase family protein [bacterium]